MCKFTWASFSIKNVVMDQTDWHPKYMDALSTDRAASNYVQFVNIELATKFELLTIYSSSLKHFNRLPLRRKSPCVTTFVQKTIYYCLATIYLSLI